MDSERHRTHETLVPEPGEPEDLRLLDTVVPEPEDSAAGYVQDAISPTDNGSMAEMSSIPAPESEPTDDGPLAGTLLGKYELLRELGRGGMGTVFLAQDTQLGRLVAIKFLNVESPSLIARFIAEARTTAQCNHENIVILYEAGEHDGKPYMVLEYIEGKSLASLREPSEIAGVDYQPWSVERSVEFIVPVLRALERAHAMGIVHRDLKPHNVMLTNSGSVKVVDFGVAKVLAEDNDDGPSDGKFTLDDRSQLVTRGLVGTPSYMSPEQIGERNVDARTDIWAIGIILWELLTGQHPLAPLSIIKLEKVAYLDIPMPRMSELHPELGELASIVDGCLVKNVDERIPSASHLLGLLEPLMPTLFPRTTSLQHIPEGTLTTGAGTVRAPDIQVAQRPAVAATSRRILGVTLLIAVLSAAVFYWPVTDRSLQYVHSYPDANSLPAASQGPNVILDRFEKELLEGELFSPNLMSNPPFCDVPIKKNITLKDQRKALARAKPERLGKETALFVALTLKEFKTARAAKQPQLLLEAQKALQTATTTLGEAIDATFLQMQLCVEMYVKNESGVLKASSELTSHFPDSNSAPWIALFHLRAWQTAEAAKLVSNWSVANFKPNDYVRAYVLAWSHFRSGEYQKAVEAMIWSVRNWKNSKSKASPISDMFLMLARAGTPIDQVLPLFAEVAEGSILVQYDWLYQLYVANHKAGHSVLAAESLEAAIKLRGTSVPPRHRVSIRQRQHNSYLAAHKVDMAAISLISAFKALTPCGQPCAKYIEPLAGQIKGVAGHCYAIFKTTQDMRYFEYSKRLYEYYLSLNRADAEQVRVLLADLESSIPMTTPTQQAMSWSIDQYSNAVRFCYELVLQREPTLKGSLKLTLEIDFKGAVMEVRTAPAAGDAGLPAVGRCLLTRARNWRFPARSDPGKTTLIREYSFSPKKEDER